MMVRSILMSRPVEEPDGPRTRKVRTARHMTWTFGALTLVAATAITALTLDRMGHLPDWAARWVPGGIKTADLRSFARASRDGQWIPYDVMRAQEFHKWCRRPDTRACPSDESTFAEAWESKAFQKEFRSTRNAYLSALPPVSLKGSSLVGADVSGANLAKVKLGKVNVDGANFSNSVLEQMDMDSQSNEGVSFSNANLRQSTLRLAYSTNLDLSKVTAQGASIHFGLQRSPNLIAASFRKAKLSGVIEGYFGLNRTLLSTFSRPADLSGADISSLTISHSFVDGREGLSGIDRARVHSNLSLAGEENGIRITLGFPGALLRNIDFRHNASLRELRVAEEKARIVGGIPGFDVVAKFSGSGKAIFTNSLADGTVQLPSWIPRPCQWIDDELTEHQLLGVWRAWLERGNKSWPPNGMEQFVTNDLKAFARLDLRMLKKKGALPFLRSISDVKPLPSYLPPKEECDWIK